MIHKDNRDNKTLTQYNNYHSLLVIIIIVLSAILIAIILRNTIGNFTQDKDEKIEVIAKISDDGTLYYYGTGASKNMAANLTSILAILLTVLIFVNNKIEKLSTQYNCLDLRISYAEGNVFIVRLANYGNVDMYDIVLKSESRTSIIKDKEHSIRRLENRTGIEEVEIIREEDGDAKIDVFVSYEYESIIKQTVHHSYKFLLKDTEVIEVEKEKIEYEY